MGHEIPEINSRKTDVNTKIIIGDSLLTIKPDKVMAKKIQAKR